jgi:DNA-binding NarL/FixJ family response regulator
MPTIAPLSVVRPRALVVGDAHELLAGARDSLSRAGFDVAVPSAATAAVLVFLFERPVAERVEAIAEAVAAHPGVPVVATMPASASGTELRDAVRAGAAGLVLAGDLARTLAPTVAAVHAGQLVMPPALSRWMAPHVLSHREKEVLGLVTRGFTNRQIADELFLAESTVKSHLSSAFAKLDTRSRAEAAALVMEPADGYGQAILSAVRDQDPHGARKIGGVAAVESA